MNNLQLSLLLEQYLYRISSAIDEIKQALPEDMAAHGKNLLGRPTKSYPVLDELQGVADDIRAAVGRLQQPSET